VGIKIPIDKKDLNIILACILFFRGNMKTFDAVIPYLKNSWGKITIGLLVLVFVNAIQLVMPLIIRNTVDGFNRAGFTQTDILKSSCLIIFLALCTIVLRYFWRMLIIGNSYVIELSLRESFYKHLMRLSQNYFNFSKIGDLMALATNDLNAVRMLFGIGLIAAADIFLLATSSFLFMISINLQLTMLVMIPMILLPFMILFFGKKLHRRFKIVQESFAKLSGMIQESISGIRIVKAFTQEDAELKKMQQYSNDFVKQNIKMAKLSGFFHPALGVLISISMVIVLVYGGRTVIRGDITIGSFIAFFSYLNMLIWPMFAIGWIVDMYQRGSASLKRLNDIWATKPEIADNDDTDYNITDIKGDLEIRSLSFAYITNNSDLISDSPSCIPPGAKEGKEPWDNDKIDITTIIFNDISFSIKAGQTLAICGRTGTGKTTLIDLLCRVYSPDKEKIFIDGKDIYKIPLELLRSSIVMVPQDIFLFSDTIANNIALGRPDASHEEIENAAKAASVYQDVMEFEKGFETIVGERGVTVSGGQKQRIAIARAILTDPKILILDDALSAVDTKTEKEILGNFIELRKNKTNIIIAHRISALSHADKIIVLSDGFIKEEGTHAELLEIGGIYSELFEKQKIEEKIQ